MFTQRDPIGLLGGLNTFQYAPNPIHWIDVLGLYEIALGISPYNDALQYDFKNVYADGSWHTAGITKVKMDSATFVSNFDNVVKNADIIHFAINDLDPALVKKAGTEFHLKNGLLQSGNVTNVELNKILNDKSLLDKTIFYLATQDGFRKIDKKSVISEFSNNCTK